MRTNGFQRPYNAMQISTWILFPLLYVQFFTCISPILPSLVASIIVSVIFGVAGLISLYLGYKASVIDPTDSHVKAEASTQQSPQNHNGNDQGEGEQRQGEETKYCWVCQTHVHEKSMHCKFCDKCVQHFDHHCQWLNTCVGRPNYAYFFGTLCALSAFLCVNAIASTYITVTYFTQRRTQDGSTYIKITTVYGNRGEIPLIVIILLVLILVAFFLALIFQLLFFHIMLQRRGMTTYEYIVQDNALRRDRAKKEREISSLRMETIAERRRQGKSILGISLVKYCPPCDPIRRQINNTSSTNSIDFPNGRNEVAVELDGEDQGDAEMVSISLPNQVNVKEQSM